MWLSVRHPCVQGQGDLACVRYWLIWPMSQVTLPQCAFSGQSAMLVLKKQMSVLSILGNLTCINFVRE